MTTTSGAIFGSEAVLLVVMFLLLMASAGSIIVYIIIVVANRADPDPTGKRPMAVYLFGGSFLSLWVAYLGSIIIVEALVSLLQTSAPDKNTVARIVVVGFLMVLVGGVVHLLHRSRGLELSNSETDPSSPTKRVMRSYVAAVSFISIVIALISAMVLGYMIFEIAAPGVFGSTGSRVDTLTSIIDLVYVVGATAFVFFSHQALAPSALRLLPRGLTSSSAAVSAEE